MDDATHSSQPMDEHSSDGSGLFGHDAPFAAAGSSGEFQARENESGAQSNARAQDHTEAAMPPEQGAPADPAGNCTDAIEIEWEEEVEAFVKAEAEKTAAAAGCEPPAEPAEATPAQSEPAAGDDAPPDAAEAGVALGFEAACQCFAGAIGEAESASADTNSSANEESGDGATAAEAAIELEQEAARSEQAAAEDAAAAEAQTKPREDRRKRRRAMISAPVRVRGVNVTHDGPDEVATTIDVSRNGILFATSAKEYYRGMDVAVMFPYSASPTAMHAEQSGRVVRVETLSDGRMAVALVLGLGAGEDLVDACGRQLSSSPAPEITPSAVKKPLVLAMDPDVNARVSMKTYLETEGYDLIGVGNVVDACHVLDILQPALVIAEIEGDGLPG